MCKRKASVDSASRVCLKLALQYISSDRYRHQGAIEKKRALHQKFYPFQGATRIPTLGILTGARSLEHILYTFNTLFIFIIICSNSYETSFLALNLLMVENSLQAVDFSQSSDNLCDIYCYCVCIVWLLICLFFCLWQELLIRKCFVTLLTFVTEHEYSVLLKLVLMVRLYSANAQMARFLGCLWAMLEHTLSEIMQMSISQWRTCCPHRRMPVCVRQQLAASH